MLTELPDDAQFKSWMAEVNERRRLERWVINVPTGLTAAGIRYRGTIWDVSPLGALVCLSSTTELTRGDRVMLMPRSYHAIPGDVRHTLDGGRLLGLMLLHGTDEQAEMAKWLDTQRTQTRR